MTSYVPGREFNQSSTPFNGVARDRTDHLDVASLRWERRIRSLPAAPQRIAKSDEPATKAGVGTPPETPLSVAHRGRLPRTPGWVWTMEAIVVSAVLCGSIVLSPSAMAWWALFLTLCQAVAMVLCSRDHKLGWALGLMMQAPWVTYDLATHQYPFIVTGLIVSAAQVSALRRLAARARAAAVDPSVGPTAPLALAEVIHPNKEQEHEHR